MNRRMRSRMYGGVGGAPEQSGLLYGSDCSLRFRRLALPRGDSVIDYLTTKDTKSTKEVRAQSD